MLDYILNKEILYHIPVHAVFNATSRGGGGGGVWGGGVQKGHLGIWLTPFFGIVENLLHPGCPIEYICHK